MKTFTDLPLELIEMIGAYLPAHSYLNLRETCRNTAKLSKVAKLHFKAYKESASGWKAENGRNFKKLFDTRSDPTTAEVIDESGLAFMDNVHLCVKDYSLTVLVWMCKNYVVDQVLRIVRLDPALLKIAHLDYKILSFKWASFFGHFDVVDLLLQDSLFDPSVDNNYAIRKASTNEHTDIVKLLLQDPRVNPAAHENEAIRFSSLNGHVDVVDLLLQDSRVDPSAKDNGALYLASSYGHLKVVERLLEDPRVDPTANNFSAIRMAFGSGYTDLAILLLQHSRVDIGIVNLFLGEYQKKNLKFYLNQIVKR